MTHSVKSSHGIAILGAFLLLTLLFINWAGKQIDSIALYIPAGSQTAAVADFDSNLVAHYTFDDTANDSAGTNNGTISGGATYVDGKIGRAMQFDGVDDYVTVSDSSSIQNIWDSGGAISFWIKPKTTGEGGAGFFVQKSSYNLFANAGVGQTGFEFDISWSGGTAKWKAPSTVPAISLNNWHHIVMTYNSDSTSNSPSLYVDGILSTGLSQVVAPSGTRISDFGNALIVGGNIATSRTVDGLIDDVRIYNKALTLAEVIELYNLGTTTVTNTTSQTTSSDIISAYDVPNTSAQTSSVSATTQVVQQQQVSGTTFYIREGGTSSVCTDWINACDSLPATLIRGATYYIADGTYGSYTFDDKIDGTKYITIKKAIINDHGTDIGWQTDYGDGTANFNNLWFFPTNSGYWIMDGQKRDSLISGYGFKVTTVVTSAQLSLRVLMAQDTDSVTLKYIDIDSGGIGICEAHHGIYAPRAKNMIIQNSYIHDFTSNGVTIGGTNNVLIENTLFARSGTLAGCAAHSQGIQMFGGSKNFIIRNNIFEDIGGTASIAFDGWSGGGTDNLFIYGNIFRQTEGYSGSGGNPGQIVEISGPGDIGLSNARIYNNVFVNLKKGISSGILIYLQASKTNYVYNNIWYNSTKAHMNGMTSHNNNYFGNTVLAYGSTFSDKEIVTQEDPFVDWRNGDYHLKAGSLAINTGKTWGGEYSYDPIGTPRPQGAAWDIGAYEYTGGGVVQPVNPPPSGGTPSIIGDFDHNGSVNALDFSAMKVYWNQNNFTYDLNKDKIVNTLDYAIMVQGWTG